MVITSSALLLEGTGTNKHQAMNDPNDNLHPIPQTQKV
jgi:hypothetical protein